MSVDVADLPMSTATAEITHDEPDQFQYRAVPVVAPMTLILGLMTALIFFTINGLIFGVASLVAGTIGWMKIRSSGGAFGGLNLVKVGMSLGLALSLAGGAVHYNAYINEVPEGFARVHFVNDIARKRVEGRVGKREFHTDIQALNGKRVFLKGYMRPSNKAKGLDSFLLVKDTGECCFGNSILPTDTVVVTIAGQKTVDYVDRQMVSVAGTFRLGDPNHFDAKSTIYFLDDVEFFEIARTSFR